MEVPGARAQTQQQGEQKATIVTILTNATIYTVDEATPWAEAVAVSGEMLPHHVNGELSVSGTATDATGTILAVGSASDVLSRFNNEGIAVDVIDMQGKFLLPGFHDVHLHAVEAGINELICYVPEDVALQDIVWYMEDCPGGGQIDSIFDEHEDGDWDDAVWVMGTGIDVGSVMEDLATDTWMESPLTVLDRDYPNTPVVILDHLGHGAIANTAAMKAVGYDALADNVDPPGGIVHRTVDGTLTGIVLENAQQPLRDAAFASIPPEVADRFWYDSLRGALQTLARHGITSVSDAGGFWRQRGQIESWHQAEKEGWLTVRASNALYVYPDELPMEGQLEALKERYYRPGGGGESSTLLRFDQAKVYVDGIISLTTAALYDPYKNGYLNLFSEDQESLGFEYFGDGLANDAEPSTPTASTLNAVSQSLVDMGFQLHYHVTGDRGAGLALDAIEALVPNNESRQSSHRLTHCYLVDERDRSRFASSNTYADFQLAPSSYESYPFYVDLLGQARASSSLLPAWELLSQHGASVTLSSDWDADVLSPLEKIETVLTRQVTEGRPTFPNVESVLPLMTINPAKLLRHEDITGSIAVGKYADFAVLDRDIVRATPFHEIGDAQVLASVLGGRVVYDPDGFFGTVVGKRSQGSLSEGTHSSSSPSSFESCRSSLLLWWSLLGGCIFVWA